MKKEKFKVVKTKLFKEQEKKLPKNIKKELNKVIKKITENPTKVQKSMSITGDASPEELRQWMGRVRADTIDLIFEYLNCKDCLNLKGEALAHAFWKIYIEEK